MSRSSLVRWLMAAPAALLAASALTGCSSDSKVLARVGDRTLTVGEFRRVSENAASRYPLPPEAAKAALLDDLLRRDLLLVAAKAHPTLTGEEIAARRARIEDEALSRALIQGLAPGSVGVSDAEVRELYRWRRTATHCQVVFTPDTPTARAALDAIRRGEDFGSVATRFDVVGMLPAQGDLGFVQPGTLVSPIDRIVRESPVGSILGPIEVSGQGWFIVRILERQPREQGPYAAEQSQLRSLLEQRKQRAFTLKRYEDLAHAYDIQVDRHGVDVMFAKYGLIQQMGGMAGPPVLTSAERAQVVGRWDGGSRFRGAYTLGEAARDLELGVRGPSSGTMLPTYHQWVRTRLLQRVAIIEARRRHLDQEPELASRLSSAIDDEVLRSFYEVAVAGSAEPTEAEVQSVYARNTEAFSRLASAKVQYMTFQDSATATLALQHVEGAPSLKDAVLLASPSLQVREETITYPSGDPLWSQLGNLFVRAPVGQAFGPIHLPSGWRIVQIVARDVRVTPFAELPAQVQQGLHQEARSAAGERRLAAITDSLRRVIPVQVNRPLLERLPWPAPSGPGTTPG